MKTEIQILADYINTDIDVFQRTYHVKINHDGSVYDCVQKLAYDTLMTWAKNLPKQII